MTSLPPPHDHTRTIRALGWILLVAVVVFVLALANPRPAHGDEPKLPREGVVSLLYIEGHWTVTLESADASEVKLVTPAPQEIACSEEQGQPKNGHPLCDKLSYTFESQAECITVQVDWTGNVHNSTDPPACKETSWPSPEPTGNPSTPTDVPVPSETSSPQPSVPPSVPSTPVTSPPTFPSTNPSPSTPATSGPSTPSPSASTGSVVGTSPATTKESASAKSASGRDQLAATGRVENIWVLLIVNGLIALGVVLLIRSLLRRH